MTEPISPSAPRISVALCTCNGETFLADLLESLAGQTQPIDELVISDDASTDGTLKIAQEFSAAAFDGKTKVIANAARLGVTRNFANAISLCTGDIVFLADQDDIWRRDKVLKMALRFKDPAVGLVFSNGEVINEDLTVAGYRLWESIWFTPAEQARVNSGDAVPVLLKHAIAAGTTLAFRASYLSRILPIPDFPHSHDIWLTLIIAAVSRLEAMNDDLIRYRLHDGNHVGLKRHRLMAQIRMARKQIQEQAFLYAANLHRAALERLQLEKDSSGNVLPGKVQLRTLELLREKIEHSKTRHDLPKKWFKRFGLVCGEARTGNYGKYSYGLKSVLQDLFLK